MAKPKVYPEKAGKNQVKAFQMAIGVDLIGSKMSMASSRTVDLEATAVGIRCTSKGSGRVIVIPYSNVKGFEMYPEPADPKLAGEGDL